MLGHFFIVPGLLFLTLLGPFAQVLGHFLLSQDLLLKCWDTSHCPRTSRSSVGTPLTVPRPLAQVLGHFALSQDLSLKFWDTSYCPKTPCTSAGHLALSQDLSLKCWDTSYCPKTACTSVGTLRTVPRPLTQVLGHFVLSQDPPHKCWNVSHCHKTPLTSVKTVGSVITRCWDSQISCSLVLVQPDLLFLSFGTLRLLSPVPPLEL